MSKRVEVEARLWNVAHEEAVRQGARQPVALTVKVDTGTFVSVIPENLARQLGLVRSDRREWFRLADGTRVQREIGLGLRVEVLDRNTVCRAAIEPGRTDVLLGLGPLEDLDLFVDTDRKTVIPNPDSPDGWVHEM